MKNTIKILIATGLFPPEIGGPATYVKILNEELPKHGISVSVLPFRIVRFLPPVLRHILYFKLVFLYSLGKDVIYAQDPVSVGLPTLLAAKLLRKKFILKIVGDYAWEQGIQRYGVNDSLDDFINKDDYVWQVKLLKKIEKYVAKNSNKIIVPSKYLRNIVSSFGVDSESIFVVHNSFEVAIPKDAKELIRNNLDIKGFVLISSGRLVPWKGFITLIDIVSKIKNKIPDIKLYIIGDGPDRKNIEEHIKKYNLEKNVLLTGRLSKKDLQKYIYVSDIFLLNTSYEGFSHVILEAMGLGVPVITTRVGGNPEVIEDGRTGFLLKKNDKYGFEQAVLELNENDKKRKEIGASAQNAVKKFTKDRMVKDTIKILL